MCWQGVKVLAFATNRLRLLYQVSDNILEMIPTVAAEEYFSFFVSRHTKHTQGKVSLWHLKVSCRKTRVATWVGAGERSLGFTSKNCLRIFSKVVAEYWTHLDNVDEATTVRTHLVGFQRETSPWGRLVFLGSYYLTRRRNCFCNVVRHLEQKQAKVLRLPAHSKTFGEFESCTNPGLRIPELPFKSPYKSDLVATTWWQQTQVFPPSTRSDVFWLIFVYQALQSLWSRWWTKWKST